MDTLLLRLYLTLSILVLNSDNLEWEHNLVNPLRTVVDPSHVGLQATALISKGEVSPPRQTWTRQTQMPISSGWIHSN